MCGGKNLMYGGTISRQLSNKQLSIEVKKQHNEK